MKASTSKVQNRQRRHRRIRAKVFGSAEKPRLSVFKSNKYISAQLINDAAGTTIASAHSKDVKGKTMMEKSAAVGAAIAEAGKAKKVSKVVFDRGGFIYTGNVEALAEAARKGGLQF
jgi:large subunit ribosomal protein L18